MNEPGRRRPRSIIYETQKLGGKLQAAEARRYQCFSACALAPAPPAQGGAFLRGGLVAGVPRTG
jgi:hypothetical protein